VIIARNRARRAPVPAAAITRMIDRWSVPTPDEAHRVSRVLSPQPLAPDDSAESQASQIARLSATIAARVAS
jgi:hypothetical protein